MDSATRVVGILQARMGSSRLPGKALLPILGRPMLQVVVERVGRSIELDELVVATTILTEDDAIADLCAQLGVACFRGSVDDVLDRFYRAAEAHRAGIAVRLTGDNPIVDAPFVDEMISRFRASCADYLDSIRTGTFPYGMAVEVFSRSVLTEAWQHQNDPVAREHVTTGIWSQPDRYALHFAQAEADWGSLRFTVDYPADLAFVQRLFHHFGATSFSWRDAVRASIEHPEWCTEADDAQ